MFDDLEPQRENANVVHLGEDVSTLSLGDLDERMAALQSEIDRLLAIRKSKENSLTAAEAFFQKPS